VGCIIQQPPPTSGTLLPQYGMTGQNELLLLLLLLLFAAGAAKTGELQP